MAHLAQLGAGQHSRIRDSGLAADSPRDERVISSDELEGDAEIAEALQRIDDARLQGIEQYEEADKRHLRFLRLSDLRLGPEFADGDTESSEALLAEQLILCLDLVAQRP